MTASIFNLRFRLMAFFPSSNFFFSFRVPLSLTLWISMSDSAAPISSVFTCISCKVAFGTADAQRLHYRSDWHRYNLKRKVAELPPVDLAQFQQKDQGNNQPNRTRHGLYSFIASSFSFLQLKRLQLKSRKTPLYSKDTAMLAGKEPLDRCLGLL